MSKHILKLRYRHATKMAVWQAAGLPILYMPKDYAGRLYCEGNWGKVDRTADPYEPAQDMCAEAVTTTRADPNEVRPALSCHVCDDAMFRAWYLRRAA